MFAGAAREAVFSSAEVVRRVNSEFVPVALKAALVNNPPGGAEGRLLREIGRSKPAPQGICVANPAGKALAWALSFDDDASVEKFLDRALERHREHPGSEGPVAALRYMRFPGAPLPEVADGRAELPEIAPHPAGEFCPAVPPRPRGTVVARVWGRALDADGKPSGDCNSQENQHHRQSRWYEEGP